MALGARRWVPDLPLDILGWLLIGVALLWAIRAQDAVNETILTGLGAVVVLQLVGIVAARWHGVSEPVRTLASNLAGLAPTLYMLARFSGARLDRLPILASRIADFRFQIQNAFGHARSLLG